jgi:hypothetical protein
MGRARPAAHLSVNVRDGFQHLPEPPPDLSRVHRALLAADDLVERRVAVLLRRGDACTVGLSRGRCGDGWRCGEPFGCRAPTGHAFSCACVLKPPPPPPATVATAAAAAAWRRARATSWRPRCPAANARHPAPPRAPQRLRSPRAHSGAGRVTSVCCCWRTRRDSAASPPKLMGGASAAATPSAHHPQSEPGRERPAIAHRPAAAAAWAARGRCCSCKRTATASARALRACAPLSHIMAWLLYREGSSSTDSECREKSSPCGRPPPPDTQQRKATTRGRDSARTDVAACMRSTSSLCGSSTPSLAVTGVSSSTSSSSVPAASAWPGGKGSSSMNAWKYLTGAVSGAAHSCLLLLLHELTATRIGGAAATAW